jgi:hypothetical protein
MNLDINNWKEFRIDKLFSRFATGKANQTILTEGNNFFYVGAKRNNNGVMVHCERDESLTLKGNCIVFICNGEGSVGYANYMYRAFIASTDRVAGYIDNLNYLRGCFLATVLSQERPKYSFGRKWKTHLKNTIIKLPSITKNDGIYEPDWKFMEDYITSLHYKPLTTKKKSIASINLKVNEWQKFQIKKIFTLLNGKSITQEEISENPGTLSAVQSGEDNNGVMGKISLSYCEKNRYTYTTKPCLTVARTGTAGFVSFQVHGCVVGDSAKILLIPDEVASTGVYLFLQTILNKNRFKYTYGRKVTEEKYLNDYIILPAKKTDNTIIVDDKCKYSDEGYIPDWNFMENYIKSLPYGDCI